MTSSKGIPTLYIADGAVVYLIIRNAKINATAATPGAQSVLSVIMIIVGIVPSKGSCCRSWAPIIP